MHDSHEPSYRQVQPQACIDELRADLKAITDCYGLGLSPETFCRQVHDLMMDGRATLERTKP